ncbi:hypothetical protein AVEN_137409-1, partial [Araneus ventricosus]
TISSLWSSEEENKIYATKDKLISLDKKIILLYRNIFDVSIARWLFKYGASRISPCEDLRLAKLAQNIPNQRRPETPIDSNID